MVIQSEWRRRAYVTDARKSNCFRFGDFVADIDTGELFRRGTKVPLQDKPFQILVLLLRRPKELIPRPEIIRSVWADTFVEGDLCLNVAMRRLRAALSDTAADSRLIETVGSRGYRFIGTVHGPAASQLLPAARERPRVAIFPLKTMSAAAGDAFAAEMTALLIAQLRHLDAPFVVITPEFTTERAHKGKGTLSLCRDVSADYVLVGAVAEGSGQLRVIVRVLDCQAQACIWAESYTRQGEDMFAIQEEITHSIASGMIQAIPIRLLPSHLEHIPPKAHESYVQGCYFFSKVTEAGMDRCVPLIEQAVRECPQFALGWAALANCYCVTARLGMAPARKAFPKAKAAAEKALAIEDLAETRTALAYYYLFYEHDWNAAESSLVRALSINPGHPPALGGYAQLLAALGQHEDAVSMLRRACDLNPLAAYPGIMLGLALYYSGDYEAALSQLRHSAELDSSLWIAHTSTGLVLGQLGQIEEAVAEFRLAVEHSDGSALAKAHLAYGLARQGSRTGAGEILGALLKLRQRRYFSPYWIAVICLGSNDTQEALRWLEVAAGERCSWMVYAPQDPILAPLRAEVRFRSLVDAINPRRTASAAR